MLHEATTWTSEKFMNAPVLPGPCIPQPKTAMTTLFEGGVWPLSPSTPPGTTMGAARTAEDFKNERRETEDPEVFMAVGLVGDVR